MSLFGGPWNAFFQVLLLIQELQPQLVRFRRIFQPSTNSILLFFRDGVMFAICKKSSFSEFLLGDFLRLNTMGPTHLPDSVETSKVLLLDPPVAKPPSEHMMWSIPVPCVALGFS